MDSKTQWAAGVACICFVAVVWTFATVLKQIIFHDLDFDEPLILAYVCNACYMVHLPLHVLGRSLGIVERVPWRRRFEEDEVSGGSSVLEAGIVGVTIAPIWFLAQWSYSAGVAGTSVTSSTVISTTSVVWTLLGSTIFLGERLTVLKSVGIIACMAGNVATLWGSDVESGQGSHLQGDLLCLAAAVAYAAYTTILKHSARPETSVALMFGALGLAVFVIGTPLALLFGWSGLKRMTPQIFGLLIFNGIFDNVLSQYAWAKAVQWTSPTAATVGLSLTIPLSVVADYARNVRVTGWSFVAAALVLVGFATVTLAARPDSGHKRTPAEGLREPLSSNAYGLNVVDGDRS